MGFDTKIKPVACPEDELLLHEEVHHLRREGDHVGDTHANVVVYAKRDHFFEIKIQKIQPCQISALNLEKQKSYGRKT